MKLKQRRKRSFLKYFKRVSTRTITTALKYGNIIFKCKQLKDSGLRKYGNEQSIIQKAISQFGSQSASQPAIQSAFFFFVSLFTSPKHNYHRRSTVDKENFINKNPKQHRIIIAVYVENK
jgi:hypothetical protein